MLVHGCDFSPTYVRQLQKLLRRNFILKTAVGTSNFPENHPISGHDEATLFITLRVNNLRLKAIACRLIVISTASLGRSISNGSEAAMMLLGRCPSSTF
jgi:hypothetical protein